MWGRGGFLASQDDGVFHQRKSGGSYTAKQTSTSNARMTRMGCEPPISQASNMNAQIALRQAENDPNATFTKCSPIDDLLEIASQSPVDHKGNSERSIQTDIAD